MAFSTAHVLGVIFLLSVFAGFTLAANNTTNATAAPTMPRKYNTTYLPTVYVTVHLEMTWADFCMLDNVFKYKLASLIFDHGIAITKGRVVIHNFIESCSESAKNKYKKAHLIVYITKHDGGHQEDIVEDLTTQAFEKLAYIVGSNNQWELGRVFAGEVDKVGLGGEKAKPIPEKMTEFEHTWTAIAIASAIVLLIVIILVIIHLIKRPKKDLRDEVRYQPRDAEHDAVITRPAEEMHPVSSASYDYYHSSTKL